MLRPDYLESRFNRWRVLLFCDARLTLDFSGTAVLTVLVGGLTRFAFFAGVVDFRLSFTSLLASNRILRSLDLKFLATSRGLNVHQLWYVVERMRASNSALVVSQLPQLQSISSMSSLARMLS